MMKFRTITEAIRRLLANQAQGAFRVIGQQKAGKGAATVLDSDRLVEVYYSKGDFPKGGGGLFGPTKHDLTYRIDLTVSKATVGDVATIEDANSTAAQMAAAIADMKESGLLADESLDELFDLVYQILMDARSADLGLDIGTVTGRWISQLQKDDPIKTGNYTILTGSMILTCSATEPVYGYTGETLADPIYNMDLELEGDTAGKAGVQVGG